jgi:hypothetical protein
MSCRPSSTAPRNRHPAPPSEHPAGSASSPPGQIGSHRSDDRDQTRVRDAFWPTLPRRRRPRRPSRRGICCSMRTKKLQRLPASSLDVMFHRFGFSKKERAKPKGSAHSVLRIQPGLRFRFVALQITRQYLLYHALHVGEEEAVGRLLYGNFRAVSQCRGNFIPTVNR